ncbi:hypothetical protein LJC26_00005, partial [Desulfovibrio sp. OttesenSCG-928-O18]|nr:hypothetical protein [Desulfovibrio sp. OttesenSCG-928-O18]
MPARDNEQWQSLVARLSGQSLGGALKAELNAALDASGAMDGKVAVSGTGMRWGMEQLQALLGPSFTVNADAKGGGGAPYSVHIAKLDAGTVNVSGQAAFDPAKQSLNASLEAALATLAPLVPEMSGALKTKAAVSGSLSALTFSLEAISNEVAAEAGTFQEIRATVAGKASLEENGKKSVSASADVALG